MAQIDFNGGMKKAKDERSIEIVRDMKADGEPVEKIVRYTGLAVNIIEDL